LIGGASDVEGPSSFLYPVYHQFCKRNGFHPVSVRIFGQHLISILSEEFPEFYDVQSVRKSTGIFIVGVQINPRVYSGEYQKGAVIEMSNPVSPAVTKTPEVEVQTTPEVQVEIVKQKKESKPRRPQSNKPSRKKLIAVYHHIITPVLEIKWSSNTFNYLKNKIQ
jgi:hypothetical protein